MPTIVVFTQERGVERVWAAEADVEPLLRFWHRGGNPACRLSDYQARGGFFATDRDRRVMLRREWDGELIHAR